MANFKNNKRNNRTRGLEKKNIQIQMTDRCRLSTLPVSQKKNRRVYLQGKEKFTEMSSMVPVSEKNSAVSKIDTGTIKNFNLEVCGQQKTRYYRATST